MGAFDPAVDPAFLPAAWPAPPGVVAFTTLRHGAGWSPAPFDHFNLGARCGDDPAAVAANRGELAARAGLPSPPHWLRQVHGTGVLRFDVAAAAGTAAEPEADAAVTAQAVEAEVGPWPPPPGTWDLLVNATPVGTAPAVDESPMVDTALTGDTVYDLVYNPEETRLLKDARARGCEVIGGLDMLVAQALEQFRWWTGRQAPSSTFRAAAAMRLQLPTANAASRRELAQSEVQR